MNATKSPEGDAPMAVAPAAVGGAPTTPTIDPKALAEVAKLVELENVRLAEITARFVGSPPDAPPTSLSLAFEFKSAWTRQDALPGFFVRFDFKATVSEQAADGQLAPIFEFAALYVLEYRMPDRVPDDWEDRLSAFARLNGVVNAWPYVRADFQNILGRVGLPALILPVFRPGKPSEARINFPLVAE